MVASKRRETPARLSRLSSELAEWRRTRRAGGRIPERFWKQAASLAAELGVSKTASVLRLSYYGLQRRVAQEGAESAQFQESRFQESRFQESQGEEAFVALPGFGGSPSHECVIELASGSGASMRVEWKGATIPDLVALSRSLWEAR